LYGGDFDTMFDRAFVDWGGYAAAFGVGRGEVDGEALVGVGELLAK
jgi:hypothetical protein